MIQILGFSWSLLSNFDVGCRKLTASWVRALAAENPDIPSCEFFEQYDRAGSAAVLPHGKKVGITDSWAKCGRLTQGYSGNTCQKLNTYEEAMLAWVEYCKFIGQDDNYIERGLLPTMPTNIWKNRCLDSSSENYANVSTSSNQDDSSYSQCSLATVHGSRAQPTSDEE
ncbi:general transcription and DNA repair factor IIH helicase subunit XPD [Trifolium repens]|nr:general transcription and DNA repair factor IIH helicase subunit XPD [Trifolium repens]